MSLVQLIVRERIVRVQTALCNAYNGKLWVWTAGVFYNCKSWWRVKDKRCRTTLILRWF